MEPRSAERRTVCALVRSLLASEASHWPSAVAGQPRCGHAFAVDQRELSELHRRAHASTVSAVRSRYTAASLLAVPAVAELIPYREAEREPVQQPVRGARLGSAPCGIGHPSSAAYTAAGISVCVRDIRCRRSVLATNKTTVVGRGTGDIQRLEAPTLIGRMPVVPG